MGLGPPYLAQPPWLGLLGHQGRPGLHGHQGRPGLHSGSSQALTNTEI